ncbi:MAG: DegV family protein [Anaerolineaceae bacterium]|nr:DegV family protein [Anaerolineaceae bacterium]
MIKIVTDTTCSIPVAELKEKGIYFVPQIITFGNESFEDDYQISSQQFLEKLKASSTLPGTAAPPPALYQPIFKEILEHGDEAVVLAPSHFLSGTLRSATLAATEWKSEHIHILDTLTIAGGFGQLVLLADTMAKSGCSAKEILAEVETLSKKEQLYFLVNTLEYLHKGGRIGSASKLIGSLLQIKPILTLNAGKVEPHDKVRTFNQAVKVIEELNKSSLLYNPNGMPSISQADNRDEAIALASRLQESLGIQDIPVYNAPPAIIVHAGPGLIVTSCFRKV